MNTSDFKLAVHTAFLGNIGRNIRGLAYDYSDDKITIYGYLNSRSSDDDYELIDIAITEIMCKYPNFINQEIILIKSHDSIGKLPCYKGWIFVESS